MNHLTSAKTVCCRSARARTTALGAAFLAVLVLLLPRQARCTVVQSDTTWTGDVSVVEDVLVPAGVTLTIAAGTRIHITPAESTKTDPEFLSPLTEIMVRGTVVAKGRDGSPIEFLVKNEKKGAWAGIIVDGGTVRMRSAVVRDADTGVYVLNGLAALNHTTLTGNRYGLTAQGPGAAVRMTATRIAGNDYGMMVLDGARVDAGGAEIRNNRKKDTFTAAVRNGRRPTEEFTAAPAEVSRIYHDEAVVGVGVWRNRVRVDGVVRVPEHSRLIILPGTVVEFTKHDTNDDGIGENGLLIQGTIIAKGTPDKPIIFRSAERKRGMGDWDSINIMNSDRSQNLIEYCQIEDAYRGLHFHFANVAVTHAVIRNDYRAVQFQESVVTIRGSAFYGNKSAVQARDSEILFADNSVYGNYAGMNLFRDSVTATGNMIMNNSLEGMRVREGLPVVERNLIDGNRHGITVSDAFYGTYNANVISHNLESGLSLKNTDSVDISGNVVQSNGINGINLQDSGAVIRNNLITDNGERGIGAVSFHGMITSNNILANGSYGLGIDGAADATAPRNWWGGGDIAKSIFDHEDDPARGKALYRPVLDRPASIAWPLHGVLTDTVWRGDVTVPHTVDVAQGADLMLAPATTVRFGQGAGLTVRGRIRAQGERSAPVTFAALQGTDAGDWDEILIDHAAGSVFKYTIFTNATWALHSHFTNLLVDSCAFTHNYGGMRFTSGPLDVRNSYFSGNEIGIRAFRGVGRFSGNVLAGNRIGLFVREKGGGLTIRRNDFSGNSDYAVRLGDFNTEDVDARNNWWGGAAPADVIYDDRQEPGIGRVRFEPYANKPFPPVPLETVSKEQTLNAGEQN